MRRFPFTRAAILLLGLTLLGAGPAVARAQQTAIVRGTVTDSVSGQPVNGAQITVAGQARGTTNDRGTYTANVPPGTVTVRVQRIGFAPGERQVTLTAGDTTTVNFALHSVAVTLAQVLVVGYGTQNRARVTGAVTTVNGSDVQNQPVAGVDAALQGKAAGVQVIAELRRARERHQRSRSRRGVALGVQPAAVRGGRRADRERSAVAAARASGAKAPRRSPVSIRTRSSRSPCSRTPRRPRSTARAPRTAS